MTLQSKMRIANILMIFGTTPLVLGIVWVLAIIAYARQHPGQTGGSDAFMMMGVLFIGYVLAVVVSGAGAVWSTFLARRHGQVRSRVSTMIRTWTFLVLLAPVLWVFGARLFLT